MQAGDLIGQRYRLEAKLGEGGLGVVWTAWQIGVERPVAIKFLKRTDHPDEVRRFDLEAQILGRLSHPNCVTVFDVGRLPTGEPFLAMERLTGRPLSDLRSHRLPIVAVVSIARQLAAALDYAHSAGVVHRDLKLENVFLVPSNSGDDVVKVLDFGLAKLTNAASADITKTGEIFGTPHYMSPEQLRGSRDAGPSTDLYACGVILFELIEGRLPFHGNSLLEIGMSHLTDPAPPVTRPDCPPELRAIIARLLEKDPTHRFASARELLRALDVVRGSSAEVPLSMLVDRTAQGSVRSTGAPSVRFESGRPSKRLALSIVAIVGVVMAVVLIAMVWPTHDVPPPRPSEEVRNVVGLIKPASPSPNEAVHPAAPDASAHDSGVVDVSLAEPTSDGCGREPAIRGDKWVQRFDLDGERRSSHWYVPRSYKPDEPHAVILMLRGTDPADDAYEFIHRADMKIIAEENDVILIAPETEDPTRSWSDGTDQALVFASLNRARTELCIDLSLIYVLGYGPGARFARELSCELPIAGLAIGRRAEVADEQICQPKPPVPTIRLFSKDDPRLPAEGGEPCGGGPPVLSAEEIALRWQSRNGCRASPKKGKYWIEDAAGECYRWEKCESSFVHCGINGAHRWEGNAQLRTFAANLRGQGDCHIEASKFQDASTIWRFFKGYGAPRDSGDVLTVLHRRGTTPEPP